MNDITALALLVSKAKASVFTMKYISQFEASDIDSDDVDLRFEVDGVETGTNVSIVDECGQAAQMITALVEALEAKQPHHNGMMQISNELVMAKQRIAELESIHAAAEKLVRCKGRYHSEQNYRALAALFGVNTPDLPPLDGESRTVTVKPPQRKTVDPYCYDQGVNCKALGYNEALVDFRINLAAAGIQVIEGEGQ